MRMGPRHKARHANSLDTAWVGWPTIFFSFEKNIHGVRAVMKNKWSKSGEKTGFGGTLGVAPSVSGPPQ